MRKILFLPLTAASDAEQVAIKIERKGDFVTGGRLIDNHLTHVGKEGEVDGIGGGIFLVVGHALAQVVVVVAGDDKRAVVLPHIRGKATQRVEREAESTVREYEFAHKTPGHGIPVLHGLVAVV